MQQNDPPLLVASNDQLGPIVPERDARRGGNSYEASMLRNLLARIHRDGGHYVEEHGLEKALDDADAKVVQWLTMQERLADAQHADDVQALSSATQAARLALGPNVGIQRRP